MRIYIAGAHSRATTMGYYLKYLDPDTEIIAYLYDNDEPNPSEVSGIPVIRIDEKSILDVECPVYLGTRGVNHPHLIETLTKCGMKSIIPVDVKLDLDIRNRYLRKYYAAVGREYIKLDELLAKDMEHTAGNVATRVYVAGSAFDKPLKDSYELLEYEKLIQVGTALADKRLATDVFDNEGDNISELNKQFCELTGLYWIWKHAKEDLVGLVHYRRHFILPDDWTLRMRSNNIDVILPTPLYVGPSIEGNYRFRHEESIWDYMLECIRNQDEEEYTAAKEFFSNNSLYSPCNMFIMKKEILNELCSWMFPILFSVAEHFGSMEDSYQNRYPGFLSERLITYYFDRHINKYKVAYADKNFLA